MSTHIDNRSKIIKLLKEELIGPSPQGEAFDFSGTPSFDTHDQFFQPRYQKQNGEEILYRDPPTIRYGVGVLYPIREHPGNFQLSNSETVDIEPDISMEVLTDEGIKSLEEIENRSNINMRDYAADDFELLDSNSFLSSSMAISFLAEFPQGSFLKVYANGGRYSAQTVLLKGKPVDWWLRSSVILEKEFSQTDVCAGESGKITGVITKSENLENLDLSIEIFSRQIHQNKPDIRLVTVCLINRTKANSATNNKAALFQAHFKVEITSNEGGGHILPYPGPELSNLDEEEQSLALLYRNKETFAIGHGCAADWEVQSSSIPMAKWVSAESLPIFETPSITPDIKRADGSIIEVSMSSLAGLNGEEDGFNTINEIVDRYEIWISLKELEIEKLSNDYKPAAQRHINECKRCLARMKAGVEYLKTNNKAKTAFKLANHAVLLQQLVSRRDSRVPFFNEKLLKFEFKETYQTPDQLISAKAERGKWRAFQIAFLLMTIESAAEGDTAERETVELIWFPTGGGKTEAYLGLAAFVIIMQRLNVTHEQNVSVLMRYTLRLLTAQQFQRATGLICALEYLRRKNSHLLGDSEFSIGIWLGSDTTPNTRETAVKALKRLQEERYSNTNNPFIIGRCPWCGAQMGKYEGTKPKKISIPRVLGYYQSANTVIFKCPDLKCEFNSRLPIYVIDEDIYEKRPALVIGTVDKFAMLTWRPEARGLFGLGMDGRRQCSPPSLIIQDELHLISGPLGSMVGLYETVIEELCTDRRSEQPVKPKIVCSTATIRRYSEQIKALFARDDIVLFPSPGLEADDSFFAHNAIDPIGKLLPGRIYVGVHAPGHGSMQVTEERVFAALLQAPFSFSPAERDPWWTLMLFFNSLRELGGGLTLFQSFVPDYLKTISKRNGKKAEQVRRLFKIMELTGRLQSEEIPKAISSLEINTEENNDQFPVDACLASNIIEVGIDIDRLSLMSIIGQPKTTSQYIQVTGRVGRRWWERPGLIVTIYGPSKPRDRSHFEKFRSYHERLYAQVEPTSVTPFSSAVLDRALHALLALYVRQAGNSKQAESPYPFPGEMLSKLKEIVLARVQAVDPTELENTREIFDKRAKQWKEWERIRWQTNWKNKEEIPLLRDAGGYTSRQKARISWATPLSMRNVDAECQAQITQLYLTGDK